ncbi:thioredoxin domain-containing protein PLP3B-like isoform X2 [Apium graveolens]|uniref:thioredoxin domain-containing protein PLP3B-like isoform X2 n=1 Tax=Apium graveolens TaxID=4045 RepID=UPI003D79B965
MDPDSVKSTLQNLAFGNVLAAAARDYKKEVLAQEKAHASSTSNQEEVDLDELMDDPELEKLHADRIAALKKEAEKRQSLKKQGHGEYRDITEADFLGEVTGCDKLICHFYHREFYRCKIMDKHLKTLAARHLETKCIRLDAENAPFFVGKLGIKTLPCVILFRFVAIVILEPDATVTISYVNASFSMRAISICIFSLSSIIGNITKYRLLVPMEL